MTKENDGPNDYEIFKDKVFSGYVLKEYTTREGLVSVWQDALDTSATSERDLDDVISVERGKYGSVTWITVSPDTSQDHLNA